MGTAVATVAAALCAAVASVVVALISRKQTKAIHEIHYEVKNSHETNLREDVDRMLSGLERVLGGQDRHEGLLRQHGREIAGLREEVRHERAERLGVERRLDDHIEAARS